MIQSTTFEMTFSSSGAAVGSEPQAAPAVSAEPRQIDLRVQRAIDEVLEYHRTHRPKNTSKNYVPKQKEWTVSAQLPLGRGGGKKK